MCELRCHGFLMNKHYTSLSRAGSFSGSHGQGRVYSKQQCPFGKKCGARHLGGRSYFFWKKLATFFITVHVSAVSSPEKLAYLFWSSLSLLFISIVHSGVAHYFRHAKKLPLLLLGPLFVGAAVQRNMLNMPKSAAGYGNKKQRTIVAKDNE